MHKISKQIFRGHVTEIMSILMSFLFPFKAMLFLCLFFFFFSLLNFDFTISSFWYSNRNFDFWLQLTPWYLIESLHYKLKLKIEKERNEKRFESCTFQNFYKYGWKHFPDFLGLLRPFLKNFQTFQNYHENDMILPYFQTQHNLMEGGLSQYMGPVKEFICKEFILFYNSKNNYF